MEYNRGSKRREIERLIDAGVSPRDIADRVGVSTAYVANVRVIQRAEFKLELERFKQSVGE